MLVARGNLANTYQRLGRLEEALRMRQEVYSGHLKLYGEEHEKNLSAANNYANTLIALDRFEEAKLLMRKTVPVARRILGRDAFLTLTMSGCYADTLMKRGDPSATLDDLHEAVRTLEDLAPTARRVLGGAHPLTKEIEGDLQKAQTTLRVHSLLPYGAFAVAVAVIAWVWRRFFT